MPNLDNHMDELFQKAAENYTLKTNTGNFDDLMPFITGEANTVTRPVLLYGKRKTALLLLAFLITTVAIGTYSIINTPNNKTLNKVTVLNSNTNPLKQNFTAVQYTINYDRNVIIDPATENMVSTTETGFLKNKPGNYTKSKMSINIMQPSAVTDEYATTENDTTVAKVVTVNKTAAEAKIQQEDKTGKSDPPTKKEQIDQSAKKEEQKTADNKKKTKPGFYYGIAGGIELNKVKSQDLTRVGFNGGLILGLQVNKKMAVETGVQLSQKKYYSDGKYFKAKAGAMPANMTVKSLQSTSSIIEIPVMVKYNFSKNKNTLYGKAGLSSYIMTRESNKYQAVVNGQQQEVNSTYKANPGYLASDVKISAGYQHSAGKRLNICVEPYIQIPLKGIGIGALPVTTTGLQIVLTRN